MNVLNRDQFLAKLTDLGLKDATDTAMSGNESHVGRYYATAQRFSFDMPPMRMLAQFLGWSDATLHQIFSVVQPVPQEVTMRQARLALLAAGKLAAVDTALNAMSEPQKSAAKITWEFSSVVKRTDPLIVALAPALGLTEQQIDQLFISAATL